MQYEKIGVLLVRFLGLIFLFVGVGGLLIALAQTAAEFNPVYWLFYLKTVLAAPLVWIFGGLVTLLLAQKIGKWLSRNL